MSSICANAGAAEPTSKVAVTTPSFSSRFTAGPPGVGLGRDARYVAPRTGPAVAVRAVEERRSHLCPGRRPSFRAGVEPPDACEHVCPALRPAPVGWCRGAPTASVVVRPAPASDEDHPVTLRIALAQVAARVGDIDGNVERVLDAWRRAADHGADLVVFTELTTPGTRPRTCCSSPSSSRPTSRRSGGWPPRGPRAPSRSSATSAPPRATSSTTTRPTRGWEVASAAGPS